ncbi:MAG: sensor histidine kinase [Acidimicrobiales bacterium]
MTASPTGPAPRWWATAVHAVGILAATGLVAATIYGGFVEEGPAHLRIAGALGLVAIAALVLRYRHPLGVLVIELVLAGAIDVLAGSSRLSGTARFVVVISLYVMGTRLDAQRSLVAAACSWAVLSGTELFDHRGIGALASDLVLIAAVTATFFYVRSYRELIESYRARAEQAEREQGWQTNRAVTAERVRIARELHDVVAHHVSLLVVQAGAVRETIPADHPTRPVLDSMIDGGRHAMAELRDMLDALRMDILEVEQLSGEVAPRTPQPDVDQVPALVSGARAAGLDVRLEIDGAPNGLPPTTSLAIYRIVQESLTNVVKHAPGATTHIHLTYGASDFEVMVTNSAAMPADPSPSRNPRAIHRQVGHGLIGMRERVALAHGHLEIGPCAGGWQVRARLPGGVDLPVPREHA